VITVGQLGEFPLITRIATTVDDACLDTPTAGGFSLKLGIGDDAAAWSIPDGVELATTDTVVEGVHFTRETIPWVDLGWKLWVANVSDVISMGGTPLVGIVTLGLPSDLDIAAVDALYAGMINACRHYRTLIAGGDIVRSRDVFASVTLNGVCEAEPLRRSGACTGHAIGVTGPLGGSGGGLRVLHDGLAANDALFSAHRRPRPRVASGTALRKAGVTTAMDVSDGLVADLAKMCHASGVGATLFAPQVPVAPALRESFDEKESLLLALGGGEDYEIVFTGDPAAVQRSVAAIDGAAVIGEITNDIRGRVSVLDASGVEIMISKTGWEHFG